MKRKLIEPSIEAESDFYLFVRNKIFELQESDSTNLDAAASPAARNAMINFHGAERQRIKELNPNDPYFGR